MIGHLRYGHALGQVETVGVDIEVARRSARAAMDLQQLPLSDEVANRHGFRVEGLWLAAAPGLVPILLQLDKLWQSHDQAGNFFSLIVSQPLVRESDGVSRLPVHIGQHQAIGVDHTIAARDRLELPWLRKPAPRHRASISCARADGLRGHMGSRASRKAAGEGRAVSA
jgi:hypothetical protein